MITILAIILAIYFIYRIINQNIFDWFETALFSVLSVLLVSVVTFSVLCVSQIWNVEVGRDNCGASIYSMKNVNGIEGTFCLGSGNINNQEYYYMFEKVNNGGLQRIKLPSRNCIIYQNENVNPNITWQNIHYRLPYWALWPNITKFQTTENSMYDIYIPSNSVVLKFGVD